LAPSLAFGLLGSFAAYGLAFLYAYLLLRHGAALQRRVVALPLLLLVLFVPLVLPDDAVRWRFILAMISLLVFVRVWETTERVPADRAALLNFRNFAAYFSSAADLRFSDEPSQQHAARSRGIQRILRAALKGLCLGALLAVLKTFPGLLQVPVLAPTWCLFSAYCAATGMCDLLTGLGMLVSGQWAEEVFRSPLLSLSPVEFWSKRWNLMFRNSAFRLLFVPLGGRRHPVWCTWGVFVFSAAVHEYVVLMALGTTRGHMSAYFLVHGCATVANLWLRRNYKITMPAPWLLLLNWVWMIATAPLFFAPILEILRVNELLSW
jgi:hypothetical protein